MIIQKQLYRIFSKNLIKMLLTHDDNQKPAAFFVYLRVSNVSIVKLACQIANFHCED